MRFSDKPRFRVVVAMFACVITVSACLIATASLHAADRIKIVLVDDSTVAEGRGWGPGFRAVLGAQFDVVNLAKNGRISRIFRDEGLWEPAIAAKPKYILMQFGHNDVPGKGEDRETDAATTYRDTMARYVDEARAAGAIPILLTSIVRRNLTDDGKVKPDSPIPYVEQIRKLAVAKQVLWIDLYPSRLRNANSWGQQAATHWVRPQRMAISTLAS